MRSLRAPNARAAVGASGPGGSPGRRRRGCSRAMVGVRSPSMDGEVEAVRESWLVEDRWWTNVPLRRRYWEVVTVDGRDVVVFRDLVSGEWLSQR